MNKYKMTAKCMMYLSKYNITVNNYCDRYLG